VTSKQNLTRLPTTTHDVQPCRFSAFKNFLPSSKTPLYVCQRRNSSFNGYLRFGGSRFVPRHHLLHSGLLEKPTSSQAHYTLSNSQHPFEFKQSVCSCTYTRRNIADIVETWYSLRSLRRKCLDACKFTFLNTSLGLILIHATEDGILLFD
jgi:hypothetical protein